MERRSAPASANTPQTINGYLYSKLAHIGSKSEGPIYFLQKFDETEIPIAKHVEIFQDDPKLRARLGTKVTVTGTMTGDAFSYASIERCAPSTEECVVQWGD